MRTQVSQLFILASVFLLVSCGGGGGGSSSAQSSGPNIPAGSLNLAGRIAVAEFVATDVDTNNPASGPLFANNAARDAQPLPNPGTVGGYVNEPGAGAEGPAQIAGDQHDFYRVNLLAGQRLNLKISDHVGTDPFRNDVDLLLVDSDLVLVDLSVGIGSTEQLVAPATDEFLVVATSCAELLFVDPIDICTQGPTATNYVLSIGQGQPAATETQLRLSDEFLVGEAVANLRPVAELSAADAGALRLSPEQAEISKATAGATVKKTTAGVQRIELALPPQRFAASNAAAPASHDKIRLRPEQWGKAQTLAAIKRLAQSGAALWAEPNFVQRTLFEPNDPGYAFQWHYPQINLPAAWDETLGDPNITVAVIDSGVLFAHPDLSGQLVPGYDFVADLDEAGDGDGDDPNAEDPGDGGFGFSSSFHGTHVAGTVAASGNNGSGVTGVAPDVRVMPIRALGINGTGNFFDVRRSMCFAAGLSGTLNCPTIPVNPNPVDIINLSLGGGGFSAAGQGVVNEVRAAGVTVVAAAGNESSNEPFYPAAYAGVIGVSAVTITGALAAYSNFGSFVDIAAPGGSTDSDVNGDGFGDGVLSTGGDDSVSPLEFIYPFRQGTSMAAPHVAGVLALMKSVNSSLGPGEFDQLLGSGDVTNTTLPGARTDAFGYGLVNAQRGVAAALAGGGMPPAPNPFLGVSPQALNFGATLDTLSFELRNTAGGAVSVLSITATPDNPADPDWLLEPAVAGLGGYTLQVDRTGLSDGTYSGTLTVVSDVNTVNVPVIMQISSLPLSGDAGPLTVRLLDDASGQFRDVTATVNNGGYEWQINGVPAGNYRLFAFTDADNDGQVCDAGEACGAYITTDQPLLLELQSSQSGLDFPVGYDGALGSQ